jgi:hypothetical protein
MKNAINRVIRNDRSMKECTSSIPGNDEKRHMHCITDNHKFDFVETYVHDTKLFQILVYDGNT